MLALRSNHWKFLLQSVVLPASPKVVFSIHRDQARSHPHLDSPYRGGRAHHRARDAGSGGACERDAPTGEAGAAVHPRPDRYLSAIAEGTCAALRRRRTRTKAYLEKLARRLRVNKNLSHREVTAETVDRALSELGQLARQRTVEAATIVFVSTAVSQSGRLDGLMVVVNQCRLAG